MKPEQEDFRPGRQRSPFTEWVMSLPLNEVVEVPEQFAGLPEKNVNGGQSPLRKAGLRAHFARLKGKRWCYVDRRPINGEEGDHASDRPL